MEFMTLGYVAMEMTVPYHRLVRFVRGRSDLPGQVKVGATTAFDVTKLDRLREVLVAERVIRQEEPAAATA